MSDANMNHRRTDSMYTNSRLGCGLLGVLGAIGLLLGASAGPLSAATAVLIPMGSTWKYLDNGSDQGTNWAQPGFSDSAWASGAAIIVDVRSPDAFALSHIEGAVNVSLGDIETHPTSLDLPKDQWIITYCT